MPPMPTEWWLRPARSAARVGEQRAVVWKRVYFRPLAASFSKAGVWHGPPNALEAPNPTSSIRITSTLGAPVGGRSGTIGGIRVSGSLALYVVTPTYGRSGIGRISRGRASFGLGTFGGCLDLAGIAILLGPSSGWFLELPIASVGVDQRVIPSSAIRVRSVLGLRPSRSPPSICPAVNASV